MSKSCAYCGSKMGLARSLKGESFCSSEHEELYLKDQSEKALARLSSPSPSLIALAAQVQPAPCQTESSVTLETADPQPAALFYSPAAASPAPVKFAAPEAECSNEVHSALSTLTVPDPAPLDPVEKIGPAPSSERKPSPVGANRIEAEPEAVSSALQRLSDSFAQNTPAAARVEAEPIISQVADPLPEKVANPVPDSTAREAAKPRSPIRLWTLSAVGAGIGIVVLGALLFNPSSGTRQPAATVKDRSPREAPPVPGPAVPKSTLTPVAVATQVPSQLPLAAKTAKTSPPVVTGAKSHASIQATGSSWVVACADGKVLFAKLFAPGSMDSVDFTRTALVRAGSAGSLQIEVDGKALGTLGAVSQVRVIELSPGESHFRAGGEPDDCTNGL